MNKPMEVTKNKIISPIKRYGGKSYLAKRIIDKMDRRPIFVEGFCGSAIISLYLANEFDIHYCFDADPYIINFWQVLQTESGRLKKFLENTEYSEENFERAKNHIKIHEEGSGDQFWDAAMLFICNRMSRSADQKTFGWSDRLRRGMPEYISAYKSAIAGMEDVSSLIQYINFRCGKYIDLMIEYELNKNPQVTSYCDPPYLPETRVSKKSYGKYEMSEADHIDLLDFITRDCHGLTYLSGYNSSLYTAALAVYECFSWEVANSASQVKTKKPRKREALWKIG